MQINNLMSAQAADVYYSEGFRRTIENYIPMLLSSSDTTTIQLSPHSLHKYEFDFFGLLASQGVPEKYRWIIMRVNGMISPMDFETDMDTIRVPSESMIEKIRQIHVGMELKLQAA